MRTVTYRTAATAVVFTGLWLFVGLLAAWSPAPGALGIAGPFFVAWLMLLFGACAVTGVLLIAAAYNAAFPPALSRPPARRTATALPDPRRLPQRPERTRAQEGR